MDTNLALYVIAFLVSMTIYIFSFKKMVESKSLMNGYTVLVITQWISIPVIIHLIATYFV